MRTRTKLIGVAAICVGAAVMVGWARGPVDPPPGPIAPSGPTLSEVLTAIQGLGGGGADQGSPVPGDLLFAGIELSAANRRAYVQVTGVTGEVAVPPYVGWIEAKSVGQTTSHPSGPGQPQFSNLRVLAPIDRAFPPVMQRATNGTPIQTVTVDFVKPYGAAGDLRYLRVTLNDVHIRDVTPVFQAGMYTMEFEFMRIEWRYTPRDAAGTVTGPDVFFCWDLESGHSC